MARLFPILFICALFLPSFALSRQHSVVCSASIVHHIATVGLLPWEKRILGPTGPYHEQFIALSLAATVIYTGAAVCFVFVARDTMVANMRAYHSMYPSRKYRVAQFDDPPREVLRSWLFGGLLLYAVRLLELYLMSFDGIAAPKKNAVIVFSPEALILFSVLCGVAVSLAIARCRLSFPQDPAEDRRSLVENAPAD